jgi:hypothetical protein
MQKAVPLEFRRVGSENIVAIAEVAELIVSAVESWKVELSRIAKQSTWLMTTELFT